MIAKAVLALGWMSFLVVAPVAAFQINTYTTDDQSPTSVIVDDAGSFTVFFKNDADGLRGTWAQRYDSIGQPSGAEFQVVPDRGALASGPGDGSFVMVWSANNGGEFDVFARRFDSLGVPAGTSFVVNASTAGGQSNGKIAHEPSGAFTIVWYSSTLVNSANVFGQRFDSAGAPIGGEFQVNTYTTGLQGVDGLAIGIAPDGTSLVAWHSRAQDDGQISIIGGGAYGQFFDSGGASIGSEFRLNETIVGGQGNGGLDIATDAQGNFTAVWNDNFEGPPYNIPGGNIMGRRYDSTGAPLTGEFLVHTKTRGPQFFSTIGATDAGDFVVTYTTYDRDGQGVEARHFDSDGNPISEAFRVNLDPAAEQNASAIGVNGAGHFVIAWQSECRRNNRGCDEDEDGDGRGAFGRRFDSAVPSCPSEPRTDCLVPGRSRLVMSTGGGGRLTWGWSGGDDFDGNEMGNPTAGLTNHVLCVYRESGGPATLLVSAAVPGAGTCVGKPCWRGRPQQTGFRYKNATGSPDGITNLKLKGEPGRPRVKAKGRGSNFSAPLPVGTFTQVTAQLINGNACWGADYTSAKKNQANIFKADF